MVKRISEEYITSIVRQVINESLSEGFFDDALNFSRYDYTLSVGSNLIDKFIDDLKSRNIRFKLGRPIEGGGNFVHFKSEKDYDRASKIYDSELMNTYGRSIAEGCKKSKKGLFSKYIN